MDMSEPDYDLRNGVSQACKKSDRYFLTVKPKFDVELDESLEKLLSEKKKAKPDTSIHFRINCPRQLFSNHFFYFICFFFFFFFLKKKHLIS